MANSALYLSKLAADAALGFNPNNETARRLSESAEGAIYQQAINEAEEENEKAQKKSMMKKTALRVAASIPGPQQPFVKMGQMAVEASGTLDPKGAPSGGQPDPSQLAQAFGPQGGGGGQQPAYTPHGTTPQGAMVYDQQLPPQGAQMQQSANQPTFGPTVPRISQAEIDVINQLYPMDKMASVPGLHGAREYAIGEARRGSIQDAFDRGESRYQAALRQRDIRSGLQEQGRIGEMPRYAEAAGAPPPWRS